MLIEENYRGHEAALANTGEPFTVPENLYIIGMMNTADRSLAMIDYALRRRFSFIDMEPGFDTEGFKKYMDSKSSDTMKALVREIKQLNDDIKEKLGKGFCIGHSYFVFDEPCSDALLRNIVNFDILPMLAEYWFDDEEQYEAWASRLNGVSRMAASDREQILIKNIYYMLVYAFKVLQQKNYKDMETVRFDNAQNLFAAILAQGIGQQLKQGLYKEYIDQKGDLSVLHGKISFPGTIRNQIAHRQQLHCEYDELSENNLLNRIIKTTAADSDRQQRGKERVSATPPQ